MRITDIHASPNTVRPRIEASIIWEDSPRDEQVVFVETAPSFREDLRASPNAFLLASCAAAMRAGEKRILVEGAICPQLAGGLEVVLAVLAEWATACMVVPVIQATEGYKAAVPRDGRRSGCFLSGGVDSLAMLQANREHFKLSHPFAFRDAFFVQGLDIAPAEPEWCPLFERALESLKVVTAEANLEVIPVLTNLRSLEPDGTAWPTQLFGPTTIAIAHAFSRRMDRVSLAASLHVQSLAPCASHPMLDPFCSASDLQVVHADAHRTRLQKVQALANWPTALQSLRVCWSQGLNATSLNCGRCRKCIMTLMQLLAAGALDQAQSFPQRNVTADMLDVIEIDDAMLVGFYEELSSIFAGTGRSDLASVIEEKIGDHRSGLMSSGRPS